jgi:hypothetical protein
MAIHAQVAIASVGDDRAVAESHRGHGTDQVIVVGGYGYAVRLMAGLAADRGIGRVRWRKSCIGGRQVIRPRNEPFGGVALHALIATGAGGNGRRHRVRGSVPLSPIGMRWRVVMALFAGAYCIGDIDYWPIGGIRIAEGPGVAAAWSVTVFALHIGKVLQIGGHRRKVRLALER